MFITAFKIYLLVITSLILLKNLTKTPYQKTASIQSMSSNIPHSPLNKRVEEKTSYTSNPITETQSKLNLENSSSAS